MHPQPTLLLDHPSEIITCVPSGGDLLGRLRGGAVLIGGDRILAVGPRREIEAAWSLSGVPRVDCRGAILAPGFVDAHTHVVFGGSRVEEYALKLTGDLDRLRARGKPVGITASMEMTRAATEDQLVESAADRLRRMLAHGTTTVESKSGYGLSLEGELKMLQTNRRLSEMPDLPDVISTFLGAHAFPPDISQQAYVDEIIEEMLPAVAGLNLARFCDVYIDDGYFNLDQTRRILLAAREHGLLLKIHADQYGALGGSELAAELGVVSADHLNYTGPETIEALAKSGVVAVLMPLIDFAVAHPQPFAARAMLDAGLEIALATDICPGGWTESLQLVIQFACRVHGFSPAEAIYAATAGGAAALALKDRGRLARGYRADIQAWDLPTVEDLVYRLGSNAVRAVYRGGAQVVRRGE